MAVCKRQRRSAELSCTDKPDRIRGSVIMNILVSVNDTYVMPLAVLLQSLFETQSQPAVLWFMWSELKEENRVFFRDFAAARGADLHWIRIGEDAFRGLPTKKYISRETYFRLLAAEFLPETVDRVLWLDADMVIQGDISGFYGRDLTGYAVAACPHGSVMRPVMAENCRQTGIEKPEQYFNAGVMLCNLERWRQMDIPARITDILRTPRRMKFPGQDLTNLIFNGEVLTEDWRKYNCMTHSILPEDLPELEKTAKIVHFAGFAKPWTFTDLPFSDAWKYWYDRSPFAGRPLKRTSYFRMKAVFRRSWEKQTGKENRRI